MSYMLTAGVLSLPTRRYVCHTCDNPGCVRPDHLWLGDARENAEDMKAKGRQAKTYRRNQAGESNNGSKLKEEQVREIRERYANGESQSSIARATGATRGNVWCIVNNKSWVGFDTSTPRVISQFIRGEL